MPPVNPYSNPYQFGNFQTGNFSLLGNTAPTSITSGAAASASNFNTNFITNLKNPTLASGAGAILSAVPGILSGNYAQAGAQAAGSYVGGAAGSAAATALGFTGGPVTIAAMLGGLAVSTLAGSFFNSKPQRHSAGANLQVEGGLASFQSSGQDRSNTQFVDEFINYVAQGTNEVLSSYGLQLPDTTGRRVGGPGSPYGGPDREIGNQYRLAVQDVELGGDRELMVVGPTGEKRSFSGSNQAQEAYEYAVTALLQSVPGFEEAFNQGRTTTPGQGSDVITPSDSGRGANEEQIIKFPKELEYGGDPPGGRGPTILSLGAAPSELKPQAQAAYYRQRGRSAIDQRRTRGIRTSPRGLRGRASTARSIVSGA